MATCYNPQVLTRKTNSVVFSLGKKYQAGFQRQELPVLVLKSMVHPRLAPVIDRIFEIPELIRLADIVSLGENQLHHVIRMAEEAVQLPEQVLTDLGITSEALLTAILFHDIGKGPEIDDWEPVSESIRQEKVPEILLKYNVPAWIDYRSPLHRHIAGSVRTAEAYGLEREIIAAIALHHHVKITPMVLSAAAKPLAMTSLICTDILQFRPAQYAVRGSSLAQLLGVLDQLCAIERKFLGRVFLSVEPGKLEDELVRDLVTGVSDKNDPRLDILGFSLHGRESVILLDLRAFGEYVRSHTEYQVQAVKKDVLNTIRSVTRAVGPGRGRDAADPGIRGRGRSRDAAGLIGGDEFVIITPVSDTAALKKMIQRVTAAIHARTGLGCRVGCGTGGAGIPANFDQARAEANGHKL